MFWGFVRLCLHAYFASDCVCVCHRVFHGCVSDCACVYIACAFSFRVVGLFVCAREEEVEGLRVREEFGGEIEEGEGGAIN